MPLQAHILPQTVLCIATAGSGDKTGHHAQKGRPWSLLNYDKAYQESSKKYTRLL